MIHIPARVELMLAKAISLHQAGRLKSTVYIDKNELYLLNGDHSVMIKHALPAGESIEGGPVVFNADDYEGAMIENVDDGIFFTKKVLMRSETQFTRVNATVPDISMQQIQELYNQFAVPTVTISFDSSWMTPIRDDLSHVELMSVDGQLHLKQRDIYAGRVYDTWREAKGVGFGSASPLPTFGPIAVRTGDFKAIMEFSANPVLLINPTDNTYFMIKDAKTGMLAIIACCLYDELGYIHERREQHGRKEPEDQQRGVVHQDACGESESGAEQSRFSRRS